MLDPASVSHPEPEPAYNPLQEECEQELNPKLDWELLHAHGELDLDHGYSLTSEGVLDLEQDLEPDTE